MKIQVTENDIINGDRGSQSFCPIAVAVRRQAKGVMVKVNTRYVSFYDNNNKYHFAYLPEDARAFILKFDNSDHVDPFEFDMVEQLP